MPQQFGMGFLYILLAVAAITATSVVAKLAGMRNVGPLDLATSLFSVSTVLGLIFLLAAVPVVISSKLLVIAAVARVGGALAVVTFNAAVRNGHFGFSNAIYRSSFVVPVVYSLVFLNGTLNLATVIGVLLVLFGIFLMSYTNSSFESRTSPEFRWFLLITLAFLLSGAPRVGQTLTSLNNLNYFAYLFLSYLAGTVLLLSTVACRRSFNRRSLSWGSAAAVCSYAGVWCTLKALESLKPATVFPISLSGPIVAGALLSLALFRERIGFCGWLGTLLAVIGISVLTIWR